MQFRQSAILFTLFCTAALAAVHQIGAGPDRLASLAGRMLGTSEATGSIDPAVHNGWIELSDENPPSASWCRPSSAQREFTIKINQGLSIQQTVLNPKITFLNEAYSFQLTATGAGTWSIQSGNLPTGITLSSAGLLSGTPISGDYIKAEGMAGRMGARLMAVVAEGARGRVYLAPSPAQEMAACEAEPTPR